MVNHKKGGFLTFGVILLLFVTFVPTPNTLECTSKDTLEDIESCTDEKLSQMNMIKGVTNLGTICCFIGVYRAIGYVDPPS
ncbi:hypothetical protein OAO35_00390 [Euryarchaeota archaeon]|nr:hypothetical protein [Euryarchaeota archaeon]